MGDGLAVKFELTTDINEPRACIQASKDGHELLVGQLSTSIAGTKVFVAVFARDIPPSPVGAQEAGPPCTVIILFGDH